MNAPAASVDIVVPVLNREDTIERTVQSLLGQTHRNLRLHVVDDGSTDATLQVLERFDDKRLAVIHQAHGGPGSARNAGAANGTADFVAFVDSDDVVRPQWLATLLHAASGAGLVRCAGRTYRDGVGQETLTTQNRSLLCGLFLVRRELFDAVGGYDERFRFSENTDLQFRLEVEARRRRLGLAEIPDVLIDVHVTPDSLSQTADACDLRDAAELFLEKHRSALAANPRHLGSWHAIAGFNSLQLGDRRAAREHLRQATALAPKKLSYRVRYWQSRLPQRRRARSRRSRRMT